MWVLHRDVIPCSPQTPPYPMPGLETPPMPQRLLLMVVSTRNLIPHRCHHAYQHRRGSHHPRLTKHRQDFITKLQRRASGCSAKTT